MHESLSNGLSVVLVNDPTCLKRQYGCPTSVWDRLKRRRVYSGPSLLAQITYPPSSQTGLIPHDDGETTQEDDSIRGLQLAHEAVYQFRMNEIDGCRGCPVRQFDAEADLHTARRSTCGNIVNCTAEIVGRTQIEDNGRRMMCITIRLASENTKIAISDRKQETLLASANCAKLSQLKVEPIDLR